MKITAVCCTYRRPRCLARLIACFEAQDCADRELVILADDGLYGEQAGDRWKITPVAKRFPTLGAKRNVAMGLVSDDVDAVAVWDDDDVYLPWALSACVAALERSPWCRPSVVLHAASSGNLAQYKTWAGPNPYYKLYHASWAFRRELIQTHPYSNGLSNGEDQELSIRLMNRTTPDADPIELGFRPYCLVGWGRDAMYIPDESPKLSWFRGNGYDRIGRRTHAVNGTQVIVPHLPEFFDYYNPTILPGVRARRF